jgi:hypothetical protein
MPPSPLDPPQRPSAGAGARLGRVSARPLDRAPLGRRIELRAAVLAGLVAGAGFAALDVLLNVMLFRGPVADQVRMTAAILLGEGVLSPGTAFDLPILLTALGVHFALSVVFAIVLAWIILRLTAGPAEVVGLAFGLLLYGVNFFILVEFFPWFREQRGWVPMLTHVAFGGIAALEYKAFARREAEEAEV